MGSTRGPKSRRFVTTGEAAEMIGISPHALVRRARAGLLTQHVDPTDLRFKLYDVAEVERFLEPRPAREEAAVGTA